MNIVFHVEKYTQNKVSVLNITFTSEQFREQTVFVMNVSGMHLPLSLSFQAVVFPHMGEKVIQSPSSK